MARLSHNRDLYDYLVRLVAEFRRRGLSELGDAIAFAVGQASSSSTEFLGEARLAICHVMKVEAGSLLPDERSEMQSVLRQIDRALSVK